MRFSMWLNLHEIVAKAGIIVTGNRFHSIAFLVIVRGAALMDWYVLLFLIVLGIQIPIFVVIWWLGDLRS